MRLMERNLQIIYYSTYIGRVPIEDEDGNETGESTNSYNYPAPLKCGVSPATGQAVAETFGTMESYDKVLTIDDLECPIDENTVLFIDNDPLFIAGEPNYDYVVKRVAKSLNFITVAVSKVKVSG